MFFQAIVTLSITVCFNITEEKYQDIFLFQGNESQAHFFSTKPFIAVVLDTQGCVNHLSDWKHSIYFLFSWPNSRKMEFNQLDVNLNSLSFTEFTFIAPIVD